MLRCGARAVPHSPCLLRLLCPLCLLCLLCPLCRELVGIGIQREPSEKDYRYLAGKAGFVVAGDAGVRAASASLEELAAFKTWFGG